MNSPTVSVIIPNYNYGRFLRESVESVLAQTYSCGEIIVVDDGSQDESLSVLEGFGDRVKVVRQQNRGVGCARNEGARIATGDLLAFLDADDIWYPTKIERQVRMFEADSDLGLVTCGMEEFAPDGKIIGLYLEGKSGWCKEAFLRFEPVVAGPGSTSLVRRSVFESVGGFDERKELHPSEDWEISYRISTVAKIGFLPEVLVGYRNHGGNGHLRINRFERAMTLALEKIYAEADDETNAFRSASYGNLYAVLAGSYFRAGQYAGFMRSALKSLRFSPSKALYFATYPLRLVKRVVPPSETR